eukprot:scaffold1312_cov393-Prasinococcus_capsulatus_cf.AAC.11
MHPTHSRLHVPVVLLRPCKLARAAPLYGGICARTPLKALEQELFSKFVDFPIYLRIDSQLTQRFAGGLLQPLPRCLGQGLGDDTIAGSLSATGLRQLTHGIVQRSNLRLSGQSSTIPIQLYLFKTFDDQAGDVKWSQHDERNAALCLHASGLEAGRPPHLLCVFDVRVAVDTEAARINVAWPAARNHLCKTFPLLLLAHVCQGLVAQVPVLRHRTIDRLWQSASISQLGQSKGGVMESRTKQLRYLPQGGQQSCVGVPLHSLRIACVAEEKVAIHHLMLNLPRRKVQAIRFHPRRKQTSSSLL